MINKKTPPTIRLTKKYFVKTVKDDIFGLSAEMAFYLLTAFFPFLILLFIIATNVSTQMQSLLFNLIKALPNDAEEVVMNVLLNFTGSTYVVVTASLFALWSTSNVISTITKSLNRFYGVSETRPFLRMRLLYVLFSIVIIIAIVLCFAFIIFGEGTGFLLSYVDYFTFINKGELWNWMRYLAVIIVLMLSLTAMFIVLPNKKLKFGDIFVGSVLTTTAWCVVSWGFSYYVNNFSRYHVLYGSIAGIIILTTWIYISGFVILSGGLLNSIILEAKKARHLHHSLIKHN